MEKNTPFVICALRIYSDVGHKLRRILKDDLYYFNDCITILNKSDEEKIIINEHRLPNGWFAENVSVQAIVGKNGSGKSSLLDYIYRIINNFGVSIVARIEELNKSRLNNNLIVKSSEDVDDIFPVFVADVEARLYFMKGGKVGWIGCCGDRVEFYFDDDKVYVDEIDNVEKLQSIAQTFCYTIGVNYAAQAYLPTDYEQENGLWYLKDGRKVDFDFPNRWVDGVFHKNDGYQLPICLNPYRNHGIIDMQREMDLAYSRLEALFMVLPENIKILQEYETADIIYYFEPKGTFQAYCEADKALYELMNSYDDFGNTLKKNSGIDHFTKGKGIVPPPSRFNGPYKCPWKDEEDFLIHFKAVVSSQGNSIASFILRKYHILFAERVIPDSTWWVCAYLVKKTLSIAANYPTYRKYKKLGKIYYFDDKLERDDKRKNALGELIEQIKKDNSHITLKVKQALNFLKDEKKRTVDYKVGKMVEKTHTIVTSLKRTPNLTKLQTKMLPPPFKAVVSFTRVDKDGKRSDVLLGQMSSGERQQIFTFSTIAYHMFNLLSVSGNERIAYKNVNIVLDELEICFHPELQRMLVYNLLTFLTGLKLNKIMAINIILSTHSPFILSDMPESNILMLEDGEKKDNKGRSFGANIYDLLCNHFFMDEFIGEFAGNKIDSLIGKINKGANSEDARRKLVDVKNDVEKISDELIRQKLLERIEVLTTNINIQ